MKERLLKTKIGDYVPTKWDGINHSCIRPLGEEILVLPDVAAEKVGSLYMPEDVKNTHSLAAQTGTIVALGEDAWRWNRNRTQSFMGRRPEPGDRIVFKRYAGQVQKGLDDLDYRIMSDIEVGGVFELTEETNG